MLPERCVRRHILRRAILGVRRCAAVRRQLSGFKGVLDPAKPFLVHFDEQTRKSLPRNERKPDLLVFFDDTAKYRIVDVTSQRGGPMSRNQRWGGALGMRIYDSLAL